MSLLPPSPRYAGPRPRGWAARDALEPAWRQWCALVDSRKVSFAMRATERAVSELVSAAVAPHGPRIALALAWKHWRHFLAMRRAAPYLAGTLVERECAVVAFKAWRRATRGRPVAHEDSVVVCWKAWRFAAETMRRQRHAKADALARELRARRDAALRRHNDAHVRAVRRENLARERRRRRDEDWGFDPVPSPRARDSDRAGDGHPALRRARRHLMRRARRVPGTKYDPDVVYADHSDESDAFDDDADGLPRVLDFDAFSHVVVAWRRWRRRARVARERRARRNQGDEAASGDEASEISAAAAIARAADRKVNARTRTTRATRSTGTHAGSRRTPSTLSSDPLLAALANAARAREMPPPTPPESPPRPATPREEMERRAAVRIQARARAFLAVKRYAERRRDPFFRVRGLRALIARGLEVFERDGERIAEAKRGWIESERRLAAMRFRNEDAVERIRTGVSELRRLDDTSERLRRDVAAAAERVRATVADRERFWAPIREASAKDPYRKPFPSFPSPEPSLRRAGGIRCAPAPMSPLDRLADGAVDALDAFVGF